MKKVRLFWEFHRSTLLINWSFSIAFSMLIFPLFFTMLPIYMMTGGPILSLFYKEISKKNEYYFYYNRSISKVSLIVVSMALNLITSFVLVKIIAHV